MLLAIDTSTRNASVALAELPADGAGDAVVVAGFSWRSAVNHTTELMPAVAQLLERRGVRPAELDAVAVALGPGGFSALRAGLSVAKGLALAARLPLIGIGSLDLEIYPVRDAGRPVCALLEAGRGEAASALAAPGGARRRDDRITGPEELLDEIRASDTGGDAAESGGPMLFCGEGMPLWAEIIRAALGGRAILCHTPPSARAGSLAALAAQRLAQGQTDDLDALQPRYLRMPTIGAPKRRDRRTQTSGRRSRRSRQGA